MLGELSVLREKVAVTEGRLARLTITRETARGWLGGPGIARHDDHARIAFSRRVYRAFDRLTTVLDPYRCDRRRRLPQDEAAQVTAAWENTDVERVRGLLQEISDRLLLVTIRLAHRRGLFQGRLGDIGADTTPIPAWHHPPSQHRNLASIESTAGRHYCGGSEEGIFGHSATPLVAASRRHPPATRERPARQPTPALTLEPARPLRLGEGNHAEHRQQ
ncbi:hypothetical protein [Streptomyces sp. NRRL F-5135]|uniref:hypothetical protein n=1 Tax=Streptomyces sp. NRRL F-5135 TaxID=1463858 RepID=UPI0004C88F52|nr:hypothetical protein [Streptomyces sp. NRRL F-5135]